MYNNHQDFLPKPIYKEEITYGFCIQFYEANHDVQLNYPHIPDTHTNSTSYGTYVTGFKTESEAKSALITYLENEAIENDCIFTGSISGNAGYGYDILKKDGTPVCNGSLIYEKNLVLDTNAMKERADTIKRKQKEEHLQRLEMLKKAYGAGYVEVNWPNPNNRGFENLIKVDDDMELDM